MRVLSRALRLAPFAAALLACACGKVTTVSMSPLPPAASARVLPKGLSQISHVVIIVQENRSFDNLFQGFPGADTQSYGYTSNGQEDHARSQSASKRPGTSSTTPVSYFAACDGQGSFPGTDCKMDGFDREVGTCGSRRRAALPESVSAIRLRAASETKPYFAMASAIRAGRPHVHHRTSTPAVSSRISTSSPARRASTVNYPANHVGLRRRDRATRSRRLRKQRAYGPQISGVLRQSRRSATSSTQPASRGATTRRASKTASGNFGARIRRSSTSATAPTGTNDVISPQTQFLQRRQERQAARRSAGSRRRARTPTTPAATRTADRIGSRRSSTPSANRKYWNSTAIFVMWDDYGGWYDHVPPPLTSTTTGSAFACRLIVISPYAKQGYVSHVQYEHGSILRFVEDQFGLAASGRDRRARRLAGRRLL